MSSRAKLIWCLLAPLLAAAVFEFVIVALDIAPRRARPLQVWNARRDGDLQASDGKYRFHPRWLWEPRPGVVLDGDPINLVGFRGPFVAAEPRTRLRLAVLGDSSTFGMAVRDAQSWPRVLESRLREAGTDVEVLNFGVVGHTLVQGRELYLGRVADYRPDILIVAYSGVNESAVAPGGVIDTVRLELLQQRSLRVRLFLDRFASLRWVASLGRSSVAPAAIAGELPSGGIPRVSVELYDRLLRILCERVRSDGAHCVLVSPARPLAGEFGAPQLLAYTDALEQCARELEVPLADVRRALADRLVSAEATELFLDRWHPSVAGHAAQAEVVAETLRSAGLLEGAPRRDPDPH